MIAKDKLVFDTTDVDTIAASDSVGAYVRASDGSLIGATSNRLHIADGGGSLTVDAVDLDIRNLVFADDKVDISGSSNVAVTDGGGSLTVDGSVTVSATDLDIRDLSHAQDSIKVGDGTDFLAVNADGSINITDNGGSLTVDATNLDIRDLAFATDKVDVSGSSVSISGSVSVTQGTSPWVIGDGGGSITVDATDLDIRDLTAASDSVAAWLKDGSGNSITSSGGALDVNIQSSDIEINVEDDKANVALENTQKNVTTTSGALLTGELSGRKFMWVQNLGGQAIYVGKSGVTTSNGLRLSPGSVLEIRLGPAVSMHAVAANGTQDTRIMEAS